jgi:hypothetical protein
MYRLAEPRIVEACDIIDAIVERRLSGRTPAAGQDIAAGSPDIAPAIPAFSR